MFPPPRQNQGANVARLLLEPRVLGALVGTTRGIGISHNKACPGCGRDFATTVSRLADPQLRSTSRRVGRLAQP
ncbi:MAG: hypothetical protein WAL63_02535 [Solirubrobacteraceae bacterium]